MTLGTGSFLNVNTSIKCSASVHGLYPLVAWRFQDKKSNTDELLYCVEGASNDTGSIIRWANNFGLFDDPSISSDIACSVEDSDGTYFIPAFSGLGVSSTELLLFFCTLGIGYLYIDCIIGLRSI